MHYWTWPAYVGVLGGLLLFAATLLPIVLIQYRRYGAISGLRLLGAAGFAVWVVALVAYTLVLSPTNPDTWCRLHAIDTVQTHPFRFVSDIANATRGYSLRQRLLAPVTLQVVFNVLLFVPLGVWCRRFFGLRLRTTVLVSLLVSLLIESTQGTGVWGLFPCAYRLADVDDVITNTFGGFLGGLGAWFVLGWMPSSTRLAAARNRPRPVTRRRRLVGVVVDLSAYLVLAVLTITVTRVAGRAVGRRIPADHLTAFEAAAGYLLPALVVFTGPALVGWGGSIGQRCVWLGVGTAGGDGSPAPVARRVARSIVSGVLTAVLLWAATQWTVPVLTWGSLLWPLLSLLAIVVLPAGRGLSFLLTGTRPVDVRTAPAPDLHDDTA